MIAGSRAFLGSTDPVANDTAFCPSPRSLDAARAVHKKTNATQAGYSAANAEAQAESDLGLCWLVLGLHRLSRLLGPPEVTSNMVEPAAAQ